MPDREKVIRKLKEALENAENEGEIFAEVRRPVLFDALALLKDDETLIQYLNDHIAMCKEEVERLYKEQETVEHAKEILCANGWEKMRFPEGTIGKWDDPEIVLCKDCKWRGTEACFCKAKDDVKDDWFCSEGEKAVSE